MKTASSVSVATRKNKAVCVVRAACVCVACLLSACASRSQFQKGYDRGSGDAVKRQYWILQNMQKPQDAAPSRPRTTIYRLPVQPDPNSTVKTVPYEIAIPITQ
ncbi:hypothetical protein BH09VER1_BH09VER1_29480 [soil metagenome]